MNGLLHCGYLWLYVPLFLIAMPLSAAETVVLQLKWRHSFQFAGYYAAAQQGYYRDAGLQVEFKEAGLDLDVVDEVCQGRAHYGVGDSAILLAYAKGQPVRLLANIFQHSAFVLISRAPQEMQSLTELKGKTIMLDPAANEIRAFLQSSGLSRGDYQEVPHDFSLQAFIQGDIDAMSAYSTNETLALRQAKVPFHTYQPRAMGIDFYGDNLFSCGVKNRRTAALDARFKAASLRGWVYAMQHPREIIQWMQQQLAVQTQTALLEEAAMAMVPLLRLDLIDPGYSSVSRWQHITEVYQQMGLLQSSLDLTDFLPPIPTKVDRTWLLMSALVLAGLILCLALLTYITRVNRRLQYLLALKRQQQGWQSCRTQMLAQLLQEQRDIQTLLKTVLHSMQQVRKGWHPVLLLEQSGHLPALVDIDLTVEGERSLRQRIAGFHDECHTPGLNILRVQQLGQPNPDFVGGNGPMQFCAFPLQGEQGQFPGVLLVWQQQPFKMQDYEILDDLVSILALGLERYMARQRLKDSEMRHRLLTEHASDVIWTMDLDGRLTYISPAVQRLRGYTAAEVMAQPAMESLLPESAQKVQQQLLVSRQQLERGEMVTEFVAELEQRHKDGHVLWVEVKTSPMYDPTGEFLGIVGVARDVTERKKSEQQIRHLAQHDALTGLPNRLLLQDRLEQALLYCQRYQSQLAVLLLDLNKFKPVNDQYGHAVGDELLCAVANRLRENLRSADTVARLGGDEFVLLLPKLQSSVEAMRVAEKIRGALAEPFMLSQHEVNIGCSIGMALYPADGDNAEQLIKVADERMYLQKKAPR